MPSNADGRHISTNPKGEQITLGPFQSFSTAGGWYWAPPVDAGDGTSSVAVDYKCTKGDAAFCPQLADMSNPHQGVSVELAVPSGIWTISKAATYRDLDFTVAAAGAGAGGAPSGGASNGGAASGDAGAAEAGSQSESEAGDTGVGGARSVGGASQGSSGSSAAGTSGTQGVAGNAIAGGGATPPGEDKGGTCGCRLAERGASRLADFVALLALGAAVRRRRSRKALLRA